MNEFFPKQDVKLRMNIVEQGILFHFQRSNGDGAHLRAIVSLGSIRRKEIAEQFAEVKPNPRAFRAFRKYLSLCPGFPHI